MPLIKYQSAANYSDPMTRRLWTQGETQDVTAEEVTRLVALNVGFSTESTDPDYQPTTTATASRTLNAGDVGSMVFSTGASATALTIPTDTVLGVSGCTTIVAYQAGAGALTFVADSGVTLRGTAPTIAQYGTMGIVRVGLNEWAYIQ